jgi:hypothetical protein
VFSLVANKFQIYGNCSVMIRLIRPSLSVSYSFSHLSTFSLYSLPASLAFSFIMDLFLDFVCMEMTPLQLNITCEIYEVFKAVSMKNAVV